MNEEPHVKPEDCGDSSKLVFEPLGLGLCENNEPVNNPNSSTFFEDNNLFSDILFWDGIPHTMDMNLDVQKRVSNIEGSSEKLMRSDISMPNNELILYDKHAGLQIWKNLENRLKLYPAHIWTINEFFYSTIDKVVFGQQNTLEVCAQNVPGRPKIAREMGRRLCDTRHKIGQLSRGGTRYFLDKRRNEIEKIRKKIRLLQRCTSLQSVDPSLILDVPKNIPALLEVGTKVKVRIYYPFNGLCNGEIVEDNGDTYLVSFDRKDLGVREALDADILEISLCKEENTSKFLSTPIRNENGYSTGLNEIIHAKSVPCESKVDPVLLKTFSTLKYLLDQIKSSQSKMKMCDEKTLEHAMEARKCRDITKLIKKILSETDQKLQMKTEDSCSVPVVSEKDIVKLCLQSTVEDMKRFDFPLIEMKQVAIFLTILKLFYNISKENMMVDILDKYFEHLSKSFDPIHQEKVAELIKILESIRLSVLEEVLLTN